MAEKKGPRIRKVDSSRPGEPNAVVRMKPRPKTLDFFYSPAFVAQVPNARILNQSLKARILAREAKDDQGICFSNVGGWHSERDMMRWGGSALREVVQATVALANGVTINRTGAKAQVEWRIDCWANINRNGNANKRHFHPGSFWSASYYVDMGRGEAREEADTGGDFLFHDPRGVAPLLSNGPGSVERVRPEEGMLILFPSWLPHSVEPYWGKGTRISIAMNLNVKKK